MAIRKAKEYTNILYNVMWMFFDKIFLLVLNLVVVVRIANHFGSMIYGTYQYAANVVAIFEVFVAFVDSRVVKKRYIDEEHNYIVWNATITRVIFSIIAMILGTLYILVVGETSEYKYIFTLLLINVILNNLRFGIQTRYEYLLKSKKIIVVADLFAALGGGLQLLAISLYAPIVVISFITMCSSLMSLLIIYIQYVKDFGRNSNIRISRTLIWDLIKESAPLAVAASCAVIYSRCDAIMIGNLLTKSEVGVYDVAVKMISVMQMAISPIRESVYPKMIKLYSENKIEYEKKYVWVTTLLTWIYIVGAFGSIIVLPFAMRILKPEYSEALSIYHIYVIGAFFMYNAGLRAGHFTLINCGKILMYSQVASVIINIILNYYLINRLGVYGAAIATVVTQASSLFVSNIFFGTRGREVLKWQLKGLNPMNLFSK